MALFENVVGQFKAKKKLDFFLQAFKETSIIPPMLFISQKGNGKTYIVKAFKEKITRSTENKPRRFIEVNCSTLRTVNQFVDQIVTPYMQPDQESVLFLDEASELPIGITNALLTILNPTPEHRNTFNHNGLEFVFDFRRHTFLMATSEHFKVFHALRDRMEEIYLEDYSNYQLSQIVSKNLQGIEINQEVLDDVATILRGNARAAAKWGAKISSRIAVRHKRRFTMDDWLELRKDLEVMPLGLEETEIRVLKLLKENGNLTLTNLSCKTGLTRNALRLGMENYLMRMSLIEVRENGRAITQLGLNVLKEIDEFKKELRSI